MRVNMRVSVQRTHHRAGGVKGAEDTRMSGDIHDSSYTE